MKKYRSLIIVPNYDVDEFVINTLGLTEMVSYGPTDPLKVHGQRAHRNPVELEIVGFDKRMLAIDIATIIDKEGYRPADYGELRGYWNDNIPEEPVLIIPSKEEMATETGFHDEQSHPVALVVTKPPGESEARFATTLLVGHFAENWRFLVTKK